MQRRTFLRTLAASVIQFGFCTCFPVRAAVKHFVARRVRPSDLLWPSATSWEKLKRNVGGNLIEVQPMFGACEPEPNGLSCLDALKNIHNPYWVGDQPAGTEVSG